MSAIRRALSHAAVPRALLPAGLLLVVALAAVGLPGRALAQSGAATATPMATATPIPEPTATTMWQQSTARPDPKGRGRHRCRGPGDH